MNLCLTVGRLNSGKSHLLVVESAAVHHRGTSDQHDYSLSRCSLIRRLGDISALTLTKLIYSAGIVGPWVVGGIARLAGLPYRFVIDVYTKKGDSYEHQA